MILGIETATSTLSVALVADAEILYSVSVHAHNLHDTLLVPIIDQMFLNIRREMRELRAIAVSAGPGSFTGLRIGMAAAKGYALALDIPLVAVPTFDAMAWRAARRIMPSEIPCRFSPVFDARRSDVYAACFVLQNQDFRVDFPATFLSVEQAGAQIPDGTYLFGDGASKLVAGSAGPYQVIPENEHICHGEAVASFGAVLLDKGMLADPGTCEPFYFREFQTTTPKNSPLG